MKIDYCIPMPVRIILAAWTSLIVMMSLSLFLWNIQLKPYDLMFVFLGTNLASISVALQVGTQCKQMK